MERLGLGRHGRRCVPTASGTVGLTMGPLVGYLMVLGLRRAKANRQGRSHLTR